MVANSLIAFLALASNWTVGNQLQLNWGGNDYVPVGLQVEANSKQIPEAMAAGIKNFNLEISASGSWKEVTSKMGDSQYFLTVNSSLPSALGTIVQPQYYRLNNIQNPQVVTANLPGATKALVIVALTRDGSVISNKTVDVVNGVLKTEVKAMSDTPQVVLIYPTGESMELEDLWERLDERRDQILRQVRIMGSQPGLRGIINPLGSTPYLVNKDNGFIPAVQLSKKSLPSSCLTNIATLALCRRLGNCRLQTLRASGKHPNWFRFGMVIVASREFMLRSAT